MMGVLWGGGNGEGTEGRERREGDAERGGTHPGSVTKTDDFCTRKENQFIFVHIYILQNKCHKS